MVLRSLWSLSRLKGALIRLLRNLGEATMLMYFDDVRVRVE